MQNVVELGALNSLIAHVSRQRRGNLQMKQSHVGADDNRGTKKVNSPMPDDGYHNRALHAFSHHRLDLKCFIQRETGSGHVVNQGKDLIRNDKQSHRALR